MRPYCGMARTKYLEFERLPPKWDCSPKSPVPFNAGPHEISAVKITCSSLATSMCASALFRARRKTEQRQQHSRPCPLARLFFNARNICRHSCGGGNMKLCTAVRTVALAHMCHMTEETNNHVREKIIPPGKHEGIASRNCRLNTR